MANDKNKSKRQLLKSFPGFLKGSYNEVVMPGLPYPGTAEKQVKERQQGK